MKDEIRGLEESIERFKKQMEEVSKMLHNLGISVKKIYDQQEDMERPPRLSDIHIDIENMKMRMISNEVRRDPDMTVIEVDLINVEDEGVNDAIYFLRSFWEDMYEKWKEKYLI